MGDSDIANSLGVRLLPRLPLGIFFLRFSFYLIEEEQKTLKSRSNRDLDLSRD